MLPVFPWSAFERAVARRAPGLQAGHLGACRLFAGFYEGFPDLVVDLYARTLVLFNYAEPPEALAGLIPQVQAWLVAQFPWVRAVVLKERFAADFERRRGTRIWGDAPDDRICEDGVWYALDVRLNQDASFYLDTRHLRAWLKATMRDKTVLNTFAYTGSLGVAALAGGARRVVQTDRSARFLALARQTYRLNGWQVPPTDLVVADFYRQTAVWRRQGLRFDCVILDPPFFAEDHSGRVDLQNAYHRLINKVRPLVAHGGYLVAVNNALFLSGQAYLDLLRSLADETYLRLERLIPVPEDVTGYAETWVSAPPADPTPFNHPTKIAVLRVQRGG